MKIISNYKDYYDFPVNQYGIDEKRIYKRTQETIDSDCIKITTNGKERHIKLDEFKIGQSKKLSGRIEKMDYFFLVCFCGMAYQGYHKSYHTHDVYRDMPDNSSGGNEFFDYTNLPDHAISLIKHQEPWSAKGKSDEQLKAYFIPEPTNINEILNCPIVIVKQYFGGNLRFILNPNLSNIDFQKVVPAMEAYQKIYTYIGYKELKVPSDPKDMNRFAAKGFDKKTSFRNM